MLPFDTPSGTRVRVHTNKWKPEHNVTLLRGYAERDANGLVLKVVKIERSEHDFVGFFGEKVRLISESGRDYNLNNCLLELVDDVKPMLVMY